MGIFRFFVCLCLLLLSSLSLASDVDNDGLPDDWEDANGLSKYNFMDAESDFDGDGLTALEEFTLGTSPEYADTDRDTLPDGWEIQYSRDPLMADYHVAVGGYPCAIDDTGLVCWRSANGYMWDIPGLINPSKIFFGQNNSCAIDDTGVVCWGATGWGVTDVPALSNPVDVSIGFSHICAIDDTGVVCWGNESEFAGMPNFLNPSKIFSNEAGNCVIHDQDTVCWGSRLNINTQMLANATDMSFGSRHGCALIDGEITCWMFFGSPDERIEVPSLVKPRMVAVSPSSQASCAIDDSGVVCWAAGWVDLNNPPELINPVSVSVGDEEICALDDTGVVCWAVSINQNSSITPALFIDPDSDGYSTQNGLDVFPLDSFEWDDIDNDGIGDNADTDWDNDGINNNNDNCILISNSDQKDSDGDLAGDLCDEDADNDGMPNDFENQNNLNPIDATDALLDSDTDGLTSFEEYQLGTLINNSDTDGDTLPDGWEFDQGKNPLVSDYQISLGYHHGCILDDSGVSCWGWNESGQTNVPPLSSPSQITAGGLHSCAIDGLEVVCWG